MTKSKRKRILMIFFIESGVTPQPPENNPQFLRRVAVAGVGGLAASTAFLPKDTPSSIKLGVGAVASGILYQASEPKNKSFREITIAVTSLTTPLIALPSETDWRISVCFALLVGGGLYFALTPKNPSPGTPSKIPKKREPLSEGLSKFKFHLFPLRQPPRATPSPTQ